jgi:hypothetical protein
VSMATIICERCGRPAVRLHPAMRFCTRGCSDEYFCAERRQAVEYFRAHGMRPVLKNGEQQQQQRSAMSE